MIAVKPLLFNGKPVILSGDKEFSLAGIAKPKKGAVPTAQFKNVRVDAFDRAVLAEVDPNAQAWDDLSDTGKAQYLLAHRKARGEHVPVFVMPGADYQTIRHTDNDRIQVSTAGFRDLAEARRFVSTYGWGHMAASFAPAEDPALVARQTAWFELANAYVFAGSLARREVTEKPGDSDYFPFTIETLRLPGAQSIEQARAAFRGEATDADKNLLAVACADDETGTKRVTLDVRGGTDEKEVIANAMLDGLTRGVWGSFADAQVELLPPATQRIDRSTGAVIAGAPLIDTLVARLEEAAARHADQPDLRERLAARIAAVQLPNFGKSAREAHFDHRIAFPLLAFETLPGVSPDEAVQLQAARHDFEEALITALQAAEAAVQAAEGAVVTDEQRALADDAFAAAVLNAAIAWAGASQVSPILARLIQAPEPYAYFDEQLPAHLVEELVVPAAQQAPAAPAGEARPARPARPAREPLIDLSVAQLAALGAGKPMPNQVRTRFAPSPTGYLHLGGARTALMNYLFARHFGGEFSLRIEDTDESRNNPDTIDPIIKGLAWIGVKSDVDIKYQSDNKALYNKKAKQLIESGHAYTDDKGDIYFKMPDEGGLEVVDHVRGRVRWSAGAGPCKDFCIMRASKNGGLPQATFLLANTVDDGEAGITHVIRGEEHLANAARQILIFRALGYPVPEYYHVGLIKNDKNVKLSKRNNDPGIGDLKAAGYDPLVVANHLIRLGANVGPEEGTLPLDELAASFNPRGLGKSPAQLNEPKLDWRSRVHTGTKSREQVKQELRQLNPRMMKRIGEHGMEALISGAFKNGHSEVAHVEDLLKVCNTFYLERREPTKAQRNAHRAPEVIGALKKVEKALRALPEQDWSMERIAEVFKTLNETAVGDVAYGRALRIALFACEMGYEQSLALAIVGRTESLSRLAAFIADA